MANTNSGGLGRRVPTDFSHLDKHPLERQRLTAPPTFTVNTFIDLPNMAHYWPLYDQGAEGACVGFGSSWAMTLLNRRAYAARTLYHEAQLIDEWDDTPPEEGTSVRAALDILRDRGHWRSVFNRRSHAYDITGPHLEEGVEANRWTTSVDDVRACIKSGVPVVIGINWYADFDDPAWDQTIRRFVIGRDADRLGRIRGGHCVCLRAAVDRWGMVGGINNWGAPELSRNPEGHPIVANGYPLFFMPYETLDRVLREDGEVTVITDRTSTPVTAPADRVHEMAAEDEDADQADVSAGD